MTALLAGFLGLLVIVVIAFGGPLLFWLWFKWVTWLDEKS